MKVPVQTLVPLYVHCTGAGNVGEAALYTDKEQLVTSIAGGTATATLTPRTNGRLRKAVFSIVTAAAGTWELSKSGTSQIATSAPDTSVLARARIGATASGTNTFVVDFD